MDNITNNHFRNTNVTKSPFNIVFNASNVTNSKALIRTINGPVDRDTISTLIPYTHLLHRIADACYPYTMQDSNTAKLPPPPQPTRPRLSVIGTHQMPEFRWDPWAQNGRNFLVMNDDELERELKVFAVSVAFDKGLVVDVTLPMDGRNIEDYTKLQELAKTLRIWIVVLTTFGREQIDTLPHQLQAEEKIQMIAKTIETELLYGYQNGKNSICAGGIRQQIHCINDHLDTNDILVAKGIAYAQIRTNAPIYLCFSKHRALSMKILETYIHAWLNTMESIQGDKQVNMSRIIICHADRWCFPQYRVDGPAKYAFLQSLCHRGVKILFDMIGLYLVSDHMLVNTSMCMQLDPDARRTTSASSRDEPPRDSEIADCVASLCFEFNFIHHVLLSANVVQRTQFRKFGGGGFAYLFEYFKRRMKQCYGMTEEQWTQIILENTLSLLAWYVPEAPPPVPAHYLFCSVCNTSFEPIEGQYFSKFEFVYCSTKCLKQHSKQKFAKV